MKLLPIFDEFGLVEKIANNLTNREVMKNSFFKTHPAQPEQPKGFV